ncbi:S-adenosyl-L-methionine-dependent methyltransferase [Biscogniauxia mediterranea]|nr:S-adenosyl-L-methionine-dependent methyltransferase [Biscogniauxia mediterranea]
MLFNMLRHLLAAWAHRSSPVPDPEVDSRIPSMCRPAGFTISTTEKPRMERQRGEGKPPTPPIEPTNGTPKPKSAMAMLAQKISTGTEKVEAYFKEKGLPIPGLDVDSPSDFPQLPDDILRCRREVIQATRELRDIMVGPRETIRWMAWDFMNTQCLQLINYYGIAKLVPTSGTIPLSELQAKAALDPINLTRVLRYAMTAQVFREPSPGHIGHTAASRLLIEDQALQAWVGFNTEDVYPGSAHVLDALRRFPEATSFLRAGYNVAFDTVDREPMFVTFGKDAARAKRMGQAMSSLTGGEGYEVSYLVGACDLSAEDARGGTLVDVGGSHGFVCADLARRWRNLRFVVQDLPRTVESAPRPVCADPQCAARIALEAHDFFDEQPVRGADVYFLRWILHNYSTPYAARILRNLVPALKPGARIVVNDQCLGGPAEEEDDRIMRGMDLVMMTLLNAQEREEEDFRRLFEMAGEGFVFKGVTRPKGSRMSIIEAVWKPDEVVNGPQSRNETSSPC